MIHILSIIVIVVCNLPAQTNLSPRSAATAQTFGTFSRGLDAVNWNPAILAYQYRITEETNIQVVTEIDTLYSLHILTADSKEKPIVLLIIIKERLNNKDSTFCRSPI